MIDLQVANVALHSANRRVFRRPKGDIAKAQESVCSSKLSSSTQPPLPLPLGKRTSRGDPSEKNLADLRRAFRTNVQNVKTTTSGRIVRTAHDHDPDKVGHIRQKNNSSTLIQGIAAQIALNQLRQHGNQEPSDDGLALSAIVHPLGRVILGTLYPQYYQRMVEACAEHGTTLSEMERSVFPMSHSAGLAELLSHWGVAPEVLFPLTVR